MKLLITDCLFPSRFSSWRNNEINYFLSRGADLLVFKVDSFAGNRFSIDWEFANREGLLDDYNIFIFDPRYNQMNAHNTRIDGRKHNGQFAASYAISRESRFDPNHYDCVYHIFMTCFERFGHMSRMTTRRQCIHLYPGGGFCPTVTSPSRIRRAAVVSTHPATTDWLKQTRAASIDCWTAPFFSDGEQAVPRAPLAHGGPLVISFASLGHDAEKGGSAFSDVADICRRRGLNTQFVAIGGQSSFDCARRIPPMNYVELEMFFRNHVSAHLNLDTGLAFNGWPLGLEAAKHGVALITTDPRSVADRYRLKYAACPLIANSPDAVADHLESLQASSDFLSACSTQCQAFAAHWSAVSKQQDAVLELLHFIAARRNSAQVRMLDLASSVMRKCSRGLRESSLAAMVNRAKRLRRRL